MKLLYSHRTKSADGQWVHIQSLTAALVERGHDVAMAGPSVEPARRLDAKSSGGLKKLLPGPVYEAAEFAYSLPAYVRLARAATLEKPDVLYERYNLHFFAGAWLHRRTGIPFILEVNSPLADERAAHGNLALKSFARKSEAAIWRAADMVLPVTGALAEIVRKAGVAEHRIEVIQNGVDTTFLQAADPRRVRARYGIERKLVLGFSGFVRDWHGVDRAVRYLARAGRDDIHLLIVGDGPARSGLEGLARELNVAQHVTVTGVVQRSDMPEYVAAFDIALQPAVVDYASPLKLFEYMALGKPVLAPDSTNILEVLRDGENGLLFRGDGFDAALDVLVTDEGLRAKVGAAARETIEREDFTWSGNAGRVESIMTRLVEAKRDNQD